MDTTITRSTHNLLPDSFFDLTTGQLREGISATEATRVQQGIQAKLDSLPPAQQEAFKLRVADLAPDEVIGDKLDEVLNRYAKAVELLANATGEVAVFIGNLARFLARVMIEQAAEQRQNALDERLKAREQAKGELMNQAGELDKAASKMLQGATTALITGLVAASIQIIASAVSLVGSVKSFNAMNTAQKQSLTAVDDAAKKAIETTLQKAQAIAGILDSVAKIGDPIGKAVGTGQSADGMMQAEAKKMEAQGARDAAEAQEFQQIADNKKQMEDALNDMMKQIINFLKEMREAEVDAMRSLTKV